MYELERKEMELEIEERRRVEVKKSLISNAARKADEPVDDSKLVEAMFDFLPDSASEAPTPGKKLTFDVISEKCSSANLLNYFYGLGRETSVFNDLPSQPEPSEIISPLQTASDDEEDLSEFKFQKFAATYFQGNIGHQYSRKPLKHSLLPLHTQGDQLVSTSNKSILITSKFGTFFCGVGSSSALGDDPEVHRRPPRAAVPHDGSRQHLGHVESDCYPRPQLHPQQRVPGGANHGNGVRIVPQTKAPLDPPQTRLADTEKKEQTRRRRAQEAARRGVYGRQLPVMAGIETDVEPGEIALHNRARNLTGGTSRRNLLPDLQAAVE